MIGQTKSLRRELAEQKAYALAFEAQRDHALALCKDRFLDIENMHAENLRLRMIMEEYGFTFTNHLVIAPAKPKQSLLKTLANMLVRP